MVGPQSSGAVSNERCGVPIKPAQGIHIDVDLALVNVTVTDPYGRSVSGLESSPLSDTMSNARLLLCAPRIWRSPK
jgi:hypothetical protein